jgi:hypothetical protein
MLVVEALYAIARDTHISYDSLFDAPVATEQNKARPGGGFEAGCLKNLLVSISYINIVSNVANELGESTLLSDGQYPPKNRIMPLAP